MRRLLTTGLLLLGLAACGTPAPGDGPAGAGRKATGAELHTTGGIAGVDTTVKLTPEAPGKLDAARRDRLFTLLADPSFTALRGSYLPSNACCDHFQYDLTVSYADGSSKKVSALSDQKSTPDVLSEVVSLLTASQK